MSSLENSCRFIGNTGDDIKITTFQNGDQLGRIPLAVNKRYKDNDGATQTITTWVNLAARNKIAEIFEKYIPKGTAIVVETEYSSKPYQANDGSTKYSNEFYVSKVRIIDNKNQEKQQQQNHQQSARPEPQEEEEDDLPF